MEHGFNPPIDKIKAKPLKFLDMNEDVHHLILENLDFDDLQSFAETNQHFSSLAVQIFRRKFSCKFVEIKSVTYAYSDDKSRIYVRDENSARRLFKQFGPSIYRMKVNYGESFDMNARQMESISRLINLYCADTLKEIVISDKQNSFFSQMTKPMKSVENVELTGDFRSLSSDNLTFGEIFPAMKSLSLPTTRIDHIDQIIQHFPHLNELRVHFYSTSMTPMMKESDVLQMLKRNPQIRVLKLHSPSESFFRATNEALPNLEYFRIEPSWSAQVSNNAAFYGTNISFKNVKILELRPPLSIDHIEFEHLEEIRAIISLGCDFDWWLNFIVKSTHLKKFHSIEGRISNTDILKFAQKGNLNLVEISITLSQDVEVKSLVDLVNANPNTEKFHFKFDDNLNRVSQLRDKFYDTWTTTHTTDSVELEKKRED